jgi:hypothetical protein
MARPEHCGVCDADRLVHDHRRASASRLRVPTGSLAPRLRRKSAARTCPIRWPDFRLVTAKSGCHSSGPAAIILRLSRLVSGSLRVASPSLRKQLGAQLHRPWSAGGDSDLAAAVRSNRDCRPDRRHFWLANRCGDVCGRRHHCGWERVVRAALVRRGGLLRCATLCARPTQLKSSSGPGFAWRWPWPLQF